MFVAFSPSHKLDDRHELKLKNQTINMEDPPPHTHTHTYTEIHTNRMRWSDRVREIQTIEPNSKQSIRPEFWITERKSLYKCCNLRKSLDTENRHWEPFIGAKNLKPPRIRNNERKNKIEWRWRESEKEGSGERQGEGEREMEKEKEEEKRILGPLSDFH